MQPYNSMDNPVGPPEIVPEDNREFRRRLDALMDREDVDHVKVFKPTEEQLAEMLKREANRKRSMGVKGSHPAERRR